MRDQGLAGVPARPSRRLDLEVVAAPCLDPDELAGAGHADALLGRLVALHLRHGRLTLLSAPARAAGFGSLLVAAGAGAAVAAAAGVAAGFVFVAPSSVEALAGAASVALAGAGAAVAVALAGAAAAVRGRGRSLGRCCGRGRGLDRGRLGSLLRLGRDGQGVGGDLVDRVLAVRGVVALGLVGRCHRDVHRLAFEQRRPFRYSVILDSIHEPGDEVPPDLRVGQLPTAEADGHLDPITIFEELDRAVDLRIEVADADLRRQADFLEGHRALLALGFLLPLRQLVLVLTEVEELDHRGLRHRGDLDEIVSPFLRHLEGLRRGHDAQLSTLFIDHPNLWDPDHLVYAQVSTDGSPLVCCWSIRPAWGHTSPYRASRQDSTRVLNATDGAERPGGPCRRALRPHGRSSPHLGRAPSVACLRRSVPGRHRCRSQARGRHESYRLAIRPASPRPYPAGRGLLPASRARQWRLLSGLRARPCAPRSRGRRAPPCTAPSAPGRSGSCSASGWRSRRPRPAGRATRSTPASSSAASMWRSAMGMTTAWTGREPQRERPREVLDEDADEPLERAVDRAVDGDRPLRLARPRRCRSGRSARAASSRSIWIVAICHSRPSASSM